MTATDGVGTAGRLVEKGDNDASSDQRKRECRKGFRATGGGEAGR